MKPGVLHLTIMERLELPKILPLRAEHEVGILCVDIREKCAKKFTKGDEKKYKIKIENTLEGPAMTGYDEKNDKGEDIWFTGAEMFLIIGRVRQLQTEKNIPTTKTWKYLYKKIIAVGERQVKSGKKERTKEMNK